MVTKNLNVIILSFPLNVTLLQFSCSQQVIRNLNNKKNLRMACLGNGFLSSSALLLSATTITCSCFQWDKYSTIEEASVVYITSLQFTESYSIGLLRNDYKLKYRFLLWWLFNEKQQDAMVEKLNSDLHLSIERVQIVTNTTHLKSADLVDDERARSDCDCSVHGVFSSVQKKK